MTKLMQNRFPIPSHVTVTKILWFVSKGMGYKQTRWVMSKENNKRFINPSETGDIESNG